MPAKAHSSLPVQESRQRYSLNCWQNFIAFLRIVLFLVIIQEAQPKGKCFMVHNFKSVN